MNRVDELYKELVEEFSNGPAQQEVERIMLAVAEVLAKHLVASADSMLKPGEVLIDYGDGRKVKLTVEPTDRSVACALNDPIPYESLWTFPGGRNMRLLIEPVGEWPKFDPAHCDHEWIYSNSVVARTPMEYQRICNRCGMMQSTAEKPEYPPYVGVYERTTAWFKAHVTGGAQ